MNFQQILEGVNHLHNKLHLAHLNLNLNQVYLDSKGDAKISGISHALPFDQITAKQVLRMKPEADQFYRAPEIWNL